METVVCTATDAASNDRGFYERKQKGTPGEVCVFLARELGEAGKGREQHAVANARGHFEETLEKNVPQDKTRRGFARGTDADGRKTSTRHSSNLDRTQKPKSAKLTSDS